MQKHNGARGGVNDRSGKNGQQRTVGGQRGYSDPVVFRVRRPSECAKCKEDLGPGRMVKLEGEGQERIALCKRCSGLAELFYVPAGDAKLTRLLSKYSKQKHVVVRWSSTRKRYERQGILVELEALNKAEAELGMTSTMDEEPDEGDESE